VFIRSGMTNYLGAIHDGNGRIGASFRELPAGSRKLVLGLAEKLERVGLGGFMTIGRSGQTLMDIPVNEGHAGAIVIGGLNPISVLEESGYRVASRAMCGLLDYNDLFHYSELPDRLSEYAASDM
jgi:repressor of nif and glnA expression